MKLRCGGKKVDACVCDEGYLLDGGKCVPEYQCGCLHNGLSIPQGLFCKFYFGFVIISI